MLTYEQAKAIAIENTIPDGKVYCSGDVGDFFYFIIVRKDFPDIPGAMFGTTYTAVDKKDGRVWLCDITEPRLKNAKIIESPSKKEDDDWSIKRGG